MVESFDIGLRDYDSVRELQNKLILQRAVGEISDSWIFCEHPPVITLGRRSTESDINSAFSLAKSINILVRRVDRGGALSIHQPGVLMAYPVINLNERGLGLKKFVSLALEAIVSGLKDSAPAAFYTSLSTAGVWVRMDQEGLRKKIASVGLRLEKGISNHGFAINIASDYSGFKDLHPCGLPVSNYTSLAAICENSLAGSSKLGISHCSDLLKTKLTLI